MATYGFKSYYGYTGAGQVAQVPRGVTRIRIECWGAKGAFYNGQVAGNGGYTSGEMDVVEGQKIALFVGSFARPDKARRGVFRLGGYNGGGNGGDRWNGATGTAYEHGAGGAGATDVRIGGTALVHRVMVAGGAGGRAGRGGAGGSGGGEEGGDAQTNLVGTGIALPDPGTGGTQDAGGGGFSPGTLGQGGAGQSVQGNRKTGGGGGGGGGYYGGGGGGSLTGTTTTGDSGGGGGSGYIDDEVFENTYNLLLSVDALPTWGRNRPGSAASQKHGGVRITVLNRIPRAPRILTKDNLFHPVNEELKIRWAFSDPDRNDTQSGYEMEIGVTGSGVYPVVAETTEEGVSTFAPGTFTAGNRYSYRIRTLDSYGEVGEWSPTRRFDAIEPPPAPTVTVDTLITDLPTSVTWAAPDAYDIYPLIGFWRIMDVDENGDRTDRIISSGYSPKQVSETDATFPLDITQVKEGSYQFLEVRYLFFDTTTGSNAYSPWTSTKIGVSVSPPQAPTVVVTTVTNTEHPHANLLITNPPATGEQIVVAYNAIYRSTSPTGPFERIAQLYAIDQPPQNWQDHLMPSGKTVYYVVEAVGINNGRALSTVHSSQITLSGAHLTQLIESEETTVQIPMHLPYNVEGGSSQTDYEVETMRFAGREELVAEWGEGRTRSVTVNVQHGSPQQMSDLLAFLDKRPFLCYRDRSGRVDYGVVASVNDVSTFYGGSGSFVLTGTAYEPVLLQPLSILVEEI